jgi:hypothetical protein
MKYDSGAKLGTTQLVSQPNEVSRVMAIDEGARFDFDSNNSSVAPFHQEIDLMFSVLPKVAQGDRQSSEGQLWSQLSNDKGIDGATQQVCVANDCSSLESEQRGHQCRLAKIALFPRPHPTEPIRSPRWNLPPPLTVILRPLTMILRHH